jgi:HEAT repeat protein
VESHHRRPVIRVVLQRKKMANTLPIVRTIAAALLLLNTVYGDDQSIEARGARADSENVSQLIRSLSDAHTPFRLAAAYNLAKMGTKATNAVPYLIRSLTTDEDHNVRAGSAYALQQIGHDAERACPALETVLRTDDYWPACRAGVALVTLTESQAKLLGLFGEILADGSDDARRATMFAIGNMGRDALSLTDSLMALLTSEERYYIRRDAAATIGKIGADNKKVLAALRKRLTDPLAHHR